MKEFDVYRIAGVNFGITCPDKAYIKYCRGYETNGKIEKIISVTEAEIDDEMKLYKDFTPAYSQAALTRIYRQISGYIIEKGGFFMHSAAIEYKNKGIAFLAPSGTGKSTHIRLWKKLLGESVEIINGDKPIVVPGKNGKYLIYGTPWAGKEGWQRNVCVPLDTVCIISRSETPSVAAASVLEQTRALLASTVIPKDSAMAEKLLEAIDGVISSVKAFNLHCNTGIESAIAAYEAITGEKYSGNI